MIYAAILAGGTGTRMGNTERPKQFLEVGGKPIIVRTAEAFVCCEEIDRVLVVTPEEWTGYTQEILSEYLRAGVNCVTGCVDRDDTSVELGNGCAGREDSSFELGSGCAGHEYTIMEYVTRSAEAGVNAGGDDRYADCESEGEGEGIKSKDSAIGLGINNIQRDREGAHAGREIRSDDDAYADRAVSPREIDDDKVAKITVLAGGSTRNETLMNAIRFIDAEGNLDDETIIVTQDAVRPFATRRMIVENIEAARRTGACETAFPATDTIIETDDSIHVAQVPDRARLWMTQTPQTFKAKKLRELYESLDEEEKAMLTDAARIFVIKGEPVEIVKGESYNIKITYPGDIGIAEAIAKRLQEQVK